MTISDMLQNSGQIYDANLLLQIQFVLLKHALPIETSSGHLWTSGENPVFLSVTVFAQFQSWLSIGKFTYFRAKIARKSSKKKAQPSVQKRIIPRGIYFFRKNFRHETYPNNILGILIERIAHILFRWRVAHKNVLPGLESTSPRHHQGWRVQINYILGAVNIYWGEGGDFSPVIRFSRTKIWKHILVYTIPIPPPRDHSLISLGDWKSPGDYICAFWCVWNKMLRNKDRGGGFDPPLPLASHWAGLKSKLECKNVA